MPCRQGFAQLPSKKRPHEQRSGGIEPASLHAGRVAAHGAEKLPTNAVKNYMTANPVTVGPNTPIRFLARQMIDAHIHRVVVVDEGQRPIGIVSGTDVLAAVAHADTEV